MATYKAIQNDIKITYGISVKTCWIAHVKSLNGFAMRMAPNRKSPESRVHECPPKMVPIIESSMKKFGML